MGFKASADLTNPPDVSLSMDTLMNYAGYAVVAGAAFTALSVAQGTITPALKGVLDGLPGVSTDESKAQGESNSAWSGW